MTEKTKASPDGGYVFIYSDSRGVCHHCIAVGGFANPLYCYYNHHADFSHDSYDRKTVVAFDSILPGGFREPEWETKMYLHMAEVFGVRKTEREMQRWA